MLKKKNKTNTVSGGFDGETWRLPFPSDFSEIMKKYI